MLAVSQETFQNRPQLERAWAKLSFDMSQRELPGLAYDQSEAEAIAHWKIDSALSRVIEAYPGLRSVNSVTQEVSARRIVAEFSDTSSPLRESFSQCVSDITHRYSGGSVREAFSANVLVAVGAAVLPAATLLGEKELAQEIRGKLDKAIDSATNSYNENYQALGLVLRRLISQ